MLTQISELASKEMDRKEFLQNAGIGALLLVGGGTIARVLGLSLSDQNRKQTVGYGSSSYGGSKR